jgi:hypothetical protein
MGSSNQNYQKSLRANHTLDSAEGTFNKVVELLGRLGGYNSVTQSTVKTSTTGANYVRLPSGNAFKIGGDNGTGTGLTFRRAGGATAAVKAAVIIGALNAMLKLEAKTAGCDGNLISIALAVAGNNTALSIAVSGNAITVNVATNGSGAATSTAAQVKAAIEADSGANALVAVTHTGGSTGAGVVAALAATNLADGADAATGTIAVASGAAISLPCGSNSNEWEVKRTDGTNTAVVLHFLRFGTV